MPKISQLKLEIRGNDPQSDSVGGNMGIGSNMKGGITSKGGNTGNFFGGPSSWDPYSKGIDPNLLRSSLASRGVSVPSKKLEDLKREKHIISEAKTEVPSGDNKPASLIINSEGGLPTNRKKTLKDAVKPKHKRKKRGSASTNGS
ncbi:hypothetical protein SAY86_013209 [Trapa natans]|uniref:Uncharacterized protein n=1 Tax=Trapa natans TaxID=22666 RepID=A0AAN7RBF2_TRANT|nr:hypothetical protein SAY86_013209 [Trapa natans]